jgi:SulP family sulfate permease
MVVTQSAATARMYALRHHQRLDENADLVGLAAANGLAALSVTFVVNGSPTQTAIAENAGARSQAAQVFAVAVVAPVLLFLSQPLQYLPQCVLGSIVFIVAIRLTDFRGLLRIRRESPGEFALAATTATVVVLVGVAEGIVLAMVVSLLRIVRHSHQPHTAVLVKGEGEVWRFAPIIPGAVSEPGLL